MLFRYAVTRLLKSALATQVGSALRLCLCFLFFFFFSGLLLLSPASTRRSHQPPWGNLSPLPPCPLPCSGLLSSRRLTHSTWRHFIGGGTNLVYGIQMYTVNRLLCKHFLHKLLPFYSSVFFSSSSLHFCFSLRLPPEGARHTPLGLGHLSMAGGLAAGK